MIADPFFWITIITLGVISTIVFLNVFAVAVGRWQMKRRKKIFPRLILSIIITFYQPLRIVLKKMGKDDRLIQMIGIDLYNHLAEEAYAKVPAEKRIVVLPHCLRDLKCPAKTDPIAGLLCVKCNRCGIGPFVEKAERYGIRTYIVNGSSFVKRVVVHFQPEAVYGVACARDLFDVMVYVNRKGIPMIGTLLLREGCVNTDVDWNEVMERFVIGLEAREDKVVSDVTPVDSVGQEAPVEA